jgi:hypothetical protein
MPKITPGIDSDSLQPISRPGEAGWLAAHESQPPCQTQTHQLPQHSTHPITPLPQRASIKTKTEDDRSYLFAKEGLNPGPISDIWRLKWLIGDVPKSPPPPPPSNGQRWSQETGARPAPPTSLKGPADGAAGAAAEGAAKLESVPMAAGELPAMADNVGESATPAPAPAPTPAAVAGGWASRRVGGLAMGNLAVAVALAGAALMLGVAGGFSYVHLKRRRRRRQGRPVGATPRAPRSPLAGMNSGGLRSIWIGNVVGSSTSSLRGSSSSGSAAVGAAGGPGSGAATPKSARRGAGAGAAASPRVAPLDLDGGLTVTGERRLSGASGHGVVTHRTHHEQRRSWFGFQAGIWGKD